MPTTRFVILLLAGVFGLCREPARAEPSDGEFANDLLHSDLPLFGDSTEDKWPQAFHDEESFGCTSRVAFGDWILREVGEEDDAGYWYRVWNYGVFHCWANVRSAYARADLSGGDFKSSFFVLLGTAKRQDRLVELWAFQMGARPGSDYLLLSRSGDDGLITSFDVLQIECPRGATRNAGSLDSLITRYCVIDSQASLLRLARRMVQKPSRGTLSFVGPALDDEEDKSAR